MGDGVFDYLWENGLVSAVRQVIDRGIDVNVKDSCERSPLWYACLYNHVEVARLLLDRGASVDAETVVQACEKGNMDVVILLFERGAAVDRTDNYTPLTAASMNGHVNVMRFLIDKGASVNNADSFEKSPLEAACYYNKPQAVQCLVDHGADRDIRDRHDNTPLHIAAGVGSNECVDVLLKAGADVNVVNTIGNTPLQNAVEQISNDCADVNDFVGPNTLHLAAGRGFKECVDALLKAGADVNVVNSLGDTPLKTAFKRKSKEYVDVLLKAGADVNAVGKYGNTPLHEAVKSSTECVDMLLKAGAVVNTTNSLGQTPLHTAVYYKDCDGICLLDVSVCQTLITHKADINKQDKEGNTPLHRLCQVDSRTKIFKTWSYLTPYLPASSCTDVYRTLVTLLVDNGADINIHNNRGVPALRGWCQTLLPLNKRIPETLF